MLIHTSLRFTSNDMTILYINKYKVSLPENQSIIMKIIREYKYHCHKDALGLYSSTAGPQSSNVQRQFWGDATHLHRRKQFQ